MRLRPNGMRSMMIPEDIFQILDAMPSLEKWIKIEDGSWINFGAVSRVRPALHRSGYAVELVMDTGRVVLRSEFETSNEAVKFIDGFMKEMTE